VMLPAKQIAIMQGAADPNKMAWQAGLAACFTTGIIEFLCAFAAPRIRAVTPRAAMIATISGTALAFLSLGFILQLYALPIIGLPTLALVLLVVYGKVRFLRGVPGMLVVVTVGTIAAWITGVAPNREHVPFAEAGFYLPLPVLGDFISAVKGNNIIPYLSIILPMGLLSGLASLQNIESAAAAGDSYPEKSSLIVNGIGTVAAALFGSTFPTSIYIGHPGWKAMGARAGYSTLNGIFITVICTTGTLSFVAWAIPIEAGVAIFIWIGMILVVQAFEVTPRRHYIAVVIGMLPGFVAWGILTAKSSLRSVGYGMSPEKIFSSDMITGFHANNLFIDGGFALEQGFLYTAVILSVMTVYIVDKRFRLAAIWALVASALCLVGLMHAYRFIPGDTVVNLPLLEIFSSGAPSSLKLLFPAWEWALGYALVAAVLLLASVLPSGTDSDEEAVQ
jgi:AGZA family xanthine/uracil permease-like MFS transporter